jgi:hypothetical protein
MPLSIEETAELCRLCQEGMFIEVQEWVKSGKDTTPHPDFGQDPLCIAAGKGFHSLVKLLCSLGSMQATLDKALAAAVAGGNLETAKLLLQNGASVAAVKGSDVFSSPNVEILGFCQETGIDLSTGIPLAWDLIHRSELAVKFLERWHQESEPVKDQAAIALVYHVREGNEDWVTRLIRAGASPRRRVESIDYGYNPTPRCTALEKAARDGTFKMLLRLGVRKSDDLQGLLLETCWGFDMAKMKHILSRGAKLNDLENGGSSVLNKCLQEMGMCGHFGLYAKSKLALEAVLKLAAMGARWVPDTRDIYVLRCDFAYMDSDECIELAKVMLREKATDHANLVKLFGSPKMRERFTKYNGGELETVLGEQWWKPGRDRRNKPSK